MERRNDTIFVYWDERITPYQWHCFVAFGGKKLPEMMRGLGQGVKQFKEGMKDIDPTENPDKEEKCETMGTGKEDKTQKEIQNDENIQKQERK